jgi:uncharacterized membrane protein YciS (DUF1049 family)
VSEILAGISLAFGFYLGWLLSTIFAMAAISRSQERMERKVRYWQGQTVHARAIADHLSRLLAAAHQGSPAPSGGSGPEGNL